MPSSKPLVVDNQQILWQLLPRLPILSSGRAGWEDSIYLEYHCQPPHELPDICGRWHGIVMFPEATAPIQLERTLDGCFQRNSVMAEDIVVAPAFVEHRSCWDAEHSFLVLGLEPKFFARAVDESAEPEQITLLPHFATPDPLIFQIGLALKRVLENNAGGSRLYAETMAKALAVHLLQNYCERKLRLRKYTGGLGRRKLQLVIDYIDQHLEQDLSLKKLAAVVEMSIHHFSRLFKQSVGMTPHQYVIHCRVERAKELLLQRKLAIAEVAHSVGFVDQSHLNRHCKRLLKVTPKTIQQG